MRYAIVLPAGSGKTYLSNKYENLIDIDMLLTSEQQNILKILCIKSMETNNWNIHQNKEYEFINEKIKNFDNNKILLLHHESKAEKYNLEVIGNFKTNESTMLKVAKERSKNDIFRETCTIHNYNSCNNSIILNTHQDIENIIKKIITKYNL